MRRETGFVVASLIISMLTACPAILFAESVEHSYEQMSPNGKYVFVMLTKSSDKAGKVDTLKKHFSHSGLYRTNGSQKSLWRINWYASEVHVSSDGEHLVRIGRADVASMNGKPNMAQLAIAFYKNGNLTKKYLVGDLVSDPARLPKSAAGFQWQKRIAFDDETKRLEVTLVTGQNKIFAVNSGNMVKPKSDNSKRRK
jgi:hypothetical protein